MKKILFTLFILMTLASGTVFATEKVCIKTGRQFYIELSNYLGLQGNSSDYKRKFLELANNLPKKGYMSEFSPSLASLLQMSDKICSDYAQTVAPRRVEIKLGFAPGDGLLMTNIFNDDTIGKEFLKSDDESYSRIERFLSGQILSQYPIAQVCEYYFAIAKERGIQITKIDNFNKTIYCDNISPKISKMLQDRYTSAELKKVKPPFPYNKVINQTYQKVLRRIARPADIENFKKMEIKDETEAVYLACVSSAASMEFIKNGKCK